MADAIMPLSAEERCINLGAELDVKPNMQSALFTLPAEFVSQRKHKIHFNAPFSPILPLPLPLLTSKPTAAQHAATVAAVQALITHVQSPLPMGGCVTPVDHFAVLFLFRLWPPTLDYTTRNKKRRREKKRKPYFHLTAVFYVYMSSRAPFPAQRFMLSHRLHLSRRLHSAERCLEPSPARLQEVVKLDFARSQHWMMIEEWQPASKMWSFDICSDEQEVIAAAAAAADWPVESSPLASVGTERPL